LIFLWWQGILENYLNLSEWTYALQTHATNKTAIATTTYNREYPVHLCAWKMWSMMQLYSLWKNFDLQNLLQVSI
jgi:hypothetical protein